MQGKIIRGIAGFYYVIAEDEQVYECKAKGAFRNKSIKPLVGDNVEIDIIDSVSFKGNIIEIKERKNSLIRPAVANVDQAMIVFALKEPQPNLNLLNRFLVMMDFQGIDTVICFNKQDMGDREYMSYVDEIYSKIGYRIHFTSVKNSEGIEVIAEELRGKTTVFAGPSGVGKSSMLNELAFEEKMKTGDLSKKLGRGKHTTRHSEIFYLGNETFVIDTPGFTSLDVPGMNEEVLKECFPEFLEYNNECRFRGCMHINEPDCKVKDAVERGEISRERYEDYCMFFEELKKKNRY